MIKVLNYDEIEQIAGGPAPLLILGLAVVSGTALGVGLYNDVKALFNDD